MKATLFLLSMLCAGLSLSAQTANRSKRREVSPATVEERATRSAGRMQKELNLTDEQRTSIRAANQSSIEKMQPLKARMTAVREEARSVRKEREAEYRRVMTAEQYAQYEASREKRRTQMLERRAEALKSRAGASVDYDRSGGRGRGRD